MRIPLVAVVCTQKHGQILEEHCIDQLVERVNDVKDNRFYKSNFYFGLSETDTQAGEDAPKEPKKDKNQKKKKDKKDKPDDDDSSSS